MDIFSFVNSLRWIRNKDIALTLNKSNSIIEVKCKTFYQISTNHPQQISSEDFLY